MMPKVKLIVTIIIALFGAGALVGVLPFFTVNTPMYPIGDTYVYQGAPDQNFGTEKRLYIGGTYSSGINNYDPLLQFDLSTYKTQQISSIVLNIYYSYFDDNTYAPSFADVWSIDTTWTETTVTWSTKPAIKQALGYLYLSSAFSTQTFVPRWLSLNITSHVKSQFALGNYLIGLTIRGDRSMWTVNAFDSKEGANKPYLEVVTAEVAPPPSGPSYTLTLVVVDQLSNPLPATVTIDTQSKTCNQLGQTSFSLTQKFYTVTAQIKVGERIYNASIMTYVDKDKIETIIITRRFQWTFRITYTDGTQATGVLTTTGKEALSISITNGVGVAYLLNGAYQLTFTASPSISLGSITVTSDQSFSVTIDKTTNTISGTPTTEAITVVQPVEIPWVLLPTTHIYILTASLVAIGVVAIWYRRRTMLPMVKKR